jgi:hypothetical protein
MSQVHIEKYDNSIGLNFRVMGEKDFFLLKDCIENREVHLFENKGNSNVSVHSSLKCNCPPAAQIGWISLQTSQVKKGINITSQLSITSVLINKAYFLKSNQTIYNLPKFL